MVVAPKFVPFNIGWLERSTPAWNFFIVNKYVNWLGDVPQELKSKFKFKPHLPLSVVDGMLITGKSHQEEAWNRYRRYLVKKDGKDRCRITKGKEFKLLAEMIEDGIMNGIFAKNYESTEHSVTITKNATTPEIQKEVKDFARAT